MQTTIRFTPIPLRLLFLWIGLPSFIFSGEGIAQDNGVRSNGNGNCSTRNMAFTTGEELTYKVYYNWNFVWLSAGEVTFRVEESNGEYHLSAHGSTYKSYDWFFKVRDKYDTWVDKKTLLPRVSIRDVAEGKYRLYDEVTFDRAGMKANSLRGKSKAVATTTAYDIQACVHDILSVLYYARNINYAAMQPGKDFPVSIFMDKEQWNLSVTYLGREADTHIRHLGNFRTVKFSPQVIEGYVFKKDSRLVVWTTDDDNRMPLMIESPISVGSVKVILDRYKGLRYPVSARINSAE
jgi:hypothetical protein